MTEKETRDESCKKWMRAYTVYMTEFENPTPEKAFKLGWDTALRESLVVRGLVEALERIAEPCTKGTKYYDPTGFRRTTAKQALSTWREASGAAAGLETSKEDEKK